MKLSAVKEFESPCGVLRIGAADDCLCLCEWVNSKHRMHRGFEVGNSCESEIIDKAIAELRMYFNGELTEFSVETEFYGTDFEKTVWKQLSEIPYGATVSYKEIAQAIGRPGSIRAVANAIGKNPISVICPCHRVIGSNGSLTGYDGGIEAKRYLLALEQQTVSVQTELFGSFDSESIGT